jgi:hypothetical protein
MATKVAADADDVVRWRETLDRLEGVLVSVGGGVLERAEELHGLGVGGAVRQLRELDAELFERWLDVQREECAR